MKYAFSRRVSNGLKRAFAFEKASKVMRQCHVLKTIAIEQCSEARQQVRNSRRRELNVARLVSAQKQARRCAASVKFYWHDHRCSSVSRLRVDAQRAVRPVMTTCCSFGSSLTDAACCTTRSCPLQLSHHGMFSLAAGSEANYTN